MDYSVIQKKAEEIIGIESMPNLEQGSEEWFMARLGVFTASTCKDLLAKETSKTFQNLLYKKVGEVMTGWIDDRQINAPTLLWGKENEAAARSAYEMIEGVKTRRVGIVFGSPNLRYACSPDALRTDPIGVEIKCPVSRVFAEIVATKQIPLDWFYQSQFSLMVTGLDAWHLVVYDPRMMRNKVIIEQIERDDEVIDRIEGRLNGAIENLDKILAEHGHRFGDQWEDRLTIAGREE